MVTVEKGARLIPGTHLQMIRKTKFTNCERIMFQLSTENYHRFKIVGLASTHTPLTKFTSDFLDNFSLRFFFQFKCILRFFKHSLNLIQLLQANLKCFHLLKFKVQKLFRARI